MDPEAAARARASLVDTLASRESLSADVLDAIGTVPRHAFVPDDQASRAYEDRPLPIGAGQTISAPHMVAVMADALALTPGDEVLEVGTGCGYHAAVTAELVGARQVTSVEYVPELADRARDTLASVGYGDVTVHVGDGREGWPSEAPYDAAYFTCAADSLPDDLLAQVRPGGRVLGPVGSRVQRLVRVTVTDDGTGEREHLGAVRFVPMQGD